MLRMQLLSVQNALKIESFYVHRLARGFYWDERFAMCLSYGEILFIQRIKHLYIELYFIKKGGHFFNLRRHRKKNYAKENINKQL